MTTHDEKYIVFKRDEFDRWMSMDDDNCQDISPPEHLRDAVVIRTKDLIAGPGLHAYAANVQTAIEALDFSQRRTDGLASTEVDELISRLSSLADYMHERATEADEIARNRQGKFPD